MQKTAPMESNAAIGALKTNALLNDEAKCQKHAKEDKADKGKQPEEGKGFAFVVGGVGAEGD